MFSTLARIIQVDGLTIIHPHSSQDNTPPSSIIKQFLVDNYVIGSIIKQFLLNNATGKGIISAP
jgi:hypothetical protein